MLGSALSWPFYEISMPTRWRILIPVVLLAVVCAVCVWLLSNSSEPPIARTPSIPVVEQPIAPANVRPSPSPAFPTSVAPSNSTGGGAAAPAGTSTVTAPSGATDDAACRDRMRKLGVVSNGPCIDVGAIVDDLAVGTYLFNKPTEAYVGVPFRLLLALQTSPSQNARGTFTGLPGAINEREGKFAQSIEATLHGDDLQIDPTGPQARTVTTKEGVEREWTITPLSGGQKTMTIVVLANIQAGSDRHKVQVKTLREPIVIQISSFDRMKMYIATASGIVVATGTTLTAIAGIVGLVPSIRRFVLKQWRRRRKKHTTR